VIAASNRNLYEEVEAERFREDLYWRLNVVPILIPPLRLRGDDIPALVAHFLTYYSELNDRVVVHIQPAAMAALQDYHWPGNVRELQNYCERAVAMADEDELTVDLLPEAVLGRGERRGGKIRGVDLETLMYEVVQQGVNLAGPEEQNLHEKIVNRVERELIAQIMQQCGSVQTKAATRLGINRNTLRSKLQEYNLETKDDG
jgi:DNA-binding NtrC family response regulator